MIIYVTVLPLSLVVARSLVKNINLVSDKFKKLSEGDADLTKVINYTNKDEFGVLIINFHKFMEMMASIIRSIKTKTEDLTRIGNNLTSSAKETSNTVSEINESAININNIVTSLDLEIGNFYGMTNDFLNFIKVVGEKIVNQSADISESSAAIEEMASSIKNVSETINTKSEIIKHLYQTAENGEKEMEITIGITKKINDSANVIMDMLKVINNIASQTNLLAMNAAIEAAHAGEYGKGFGVVADEIRKLAENTANNSKSISNSLKDVIDHIHKSEEITQNTGKYFKNIVLEIEEVSNAMLEIKNATSELFSGSKQIITSLSSMIKSSEELKHLSFEMKEKNTNMYSSVKNLSSMSNNTKDKVGVITSSIVEIHKLTENVTKDTELNSTTISEINKLIYKFKT